MTLRDRSRALLMFSLVAVCSCGDESPVAPAVSPESPATAATQDRAQSRSSPNVVFEDIAEEVGLDYRHCNGMSGKFYLCEPLGPGAALFDMDGDGDLDLFVVQGNLLGGASAEESLFPLPGPLPLKDRLFRNLLAESGELRFEDASAGSGVEGEGYGMGVAAGDVDNDGDVDLYVTNFGDNALYLNHGDGTFRDATESAGAQESRWSTSASFADYDRDGWLDLYLCNYVDFSLATHKSCYASTGAEDYCGPLAFSPYVDRLLRNRGDGTFEDATASAKIFGEYGGALGVVASDLNGDDWVDFYVANDASPNQLWINQKDGSFLNEAVLAGCAVNQFGAPEGSMGIDAGDFDGDGDDDLFMTHITAETNTLYLNDGTGFFEDYTSETKLGAPSRIHTGFGAAWFDYDHDGWLDLLVVNGAVKAIESLARAGDPFPLHEPNQLFRNQGNLVFQEVSDRAGEVFGLSEVSRAAVFGDVDNDGDSDVLVTNNNGELRLLRNNLSTNERWLGLRLLDKEGVRDQYGARVELVLSDGRRLHRRSRADASYLASNDPRVLAGWKDAKLQEIVVRWPDGDAQHWDFAERSLARYYTLRQGVDEIRE